MRRYVLGDGQSENMFINGMGFRVIYLIYTSLAACCYNNVRKIFWRQQEQTIKNNRPIPHI